MDRRRDRAATISAGYGAMIHRLRLAVALAPLVAACAGALAAGPLATASPAGDALPPSHESLAIPRPDAHPYFGYNEDWFAHRGRLGFTARGGADTTRVVISWNRTEPNPGDLRWRRYDRLYAHILENGMLPRTTRTSPPSPSALPSATRPPSRSRPGTSPTSGRSGGPSPGPREPPSSPRGPTGG
jgi:hypothetical protein